MNQETLIVFQEKNIRRIWRNEEWYFSVIDVVNALAGNAKEETEQELGRPITSRKN